MEDKELPVKEKEKEAQSIINNYVLGAMGVGLVPLPFLDMIAITGVQLKMIHSLANCFNLKFSSSIGKSIIGSLLGGTLPITFTPLVGSLIKIIPLVGHTASAVTMPIVSGAATYALGKVFLAHFATGGTMLDFDPETVRGYFAEQFKEGKQVASTLRASKS